MLTLQEVIRARLNDGLDWSEMSLRLVAMRAEMVDVIRQRNAMGGSEPGPGVVEQLRQSYRPELRRRTPQRGAAMAKEKPGRSRASLS